MPEIVNLVKEGKLLNTYSLIIEIDYIIRCYVKVAEFAVSVL